MKSSPNLPRVAILTNTMNAWGYSLARGILTYATEVGPWDIYVQPQGPRIIEQLPEGWSGDGVISRVLSPHFAKEITKLGLPIVNVSDSLLEGFSSPTVQTDDRVGCQLALQHFIKRGLSNVAFVGEIFRPNQVTYAETFIEEAEKQGFSCNRMIYASERTERKKLSQWLASLPKPIGILALGNPLALETVYACNETGIHVPDEVAILSSHYDELLSHACTPALSGLIAPAEQIGYKAAQLLDRMIQGEQVPHEVVRIPPRAITESESTNTIAINDPQVVQVTNYIKAHATENISMQDILTTVPMTRRSLERRFHKAFGRTIFAEIRQLRIEKARKLLSESDLQMQCIAEACGYSSYSNMSSAFKKVTGISPREHRKQYKLS